MFYKVATNTELVDTEPGHTGLRSCKSLVTTFSSTEQSITLCFCLKILNLICIVNSLTLNSMANSTTSNE